MAIQNKTVTFQGSLTTLTSFNVFLQAGGAYTVVASGVATDGSGNTQQIAVTINLPAGTAVLDNMAARALTELRKANGLEV